MRFTLDADGFVRLDSRAAERGRGAWLCPRISCLNAALGRGGFSRSFRQKVQGKPGLDVEQYVSEQLRGHVADLENRSARTRVAPLPMGEIRIATLRGGEAANGPCARKLERTRERLRSWTAGRAEGELSSSSDAREREGL